MNSERSGIHWRPAILILVIMVVVESIAYTILGNVLGETTFQVLSLQASILLTTVLLLLWWLLFSRARLIWRVLSLVVLIGAALVAPKFLRFEGVSGGMIPLIALQSSPTADEKAAQLLGKESEPDSADPDSEPLLTAGPGDWPQFRGPGRDGIVDHLTIPDKWIPGEPMWTIPVGLGWSSFSAVGEFAFTQEQRGAMECVVCYDVESGKQRWVHQNEARFSETMGGDGPRATPTFHQGLLYVQGATGILDCLNARSGELVWSTHILEDAKTSNIEWGMAGSPLIHGDLVIVSPGGSNESSLVAYNKNTGVRAWGAGTSPASYSSPRLHPSVAGDQILVFNARGLFAHSPETGSILWNFDYTNFSKINVSQPVTVSPEKILLPTGYSKGTTLLSIGRTDQGEWLVTQEWQSKRLKPKFNNVVATDGYAFGLDEGILTCVDLNTGKRMWKDGRFGYGQLLLIDDKLMILSERGEIILVKSQPGGFQVVSRTRCLEGKSWSHPAIVNEILMIRNGEQARAYRLTL